MIFLILSKFYFKNKFVNIYYIYCMNINKLVQAILSQHAEYREQNFRQIQQDMMNKMQKLQQKQKKHNKSTELKMLETFCKILERIGIQVAQMKYKYEHADRDAMKLDKMHQIASQLNFFRNECYDTKQRIICHKRKIGYLKSQNACLLAQNQAISKVIEQKQQNKNNSLVFSKHTGALPSNSNHGQVCGKTISCSKRSHMACKKNSSVKIGVQKLKYADVFKSDEIEFEDEFGNEFGENSLEQKSIHPKNAKTWGSMKLGNKIRTLNFNRHHA